MDLTSKQKNIIDLLKSVGLTIRYDSTMYYPVPTSVRRSGRMNVTAKELQTLIKSKHIGKLEYANGRVKEIPN